MQGLAPLATLLFTVYIGEKRNPKVVCLSLLAESVLALALFFVCVRNQ